MEHVHGLGCSSTATSFSLDITTAVILLQEDPELKGMVKRHVQCF